MTTEHLRVSPKAGTTLIVSLAFASAGITALFLGMRSVMDIGGFCAEGGPYVIEHHCPDGVAGVMVGSIWLGAIAAIIYAVAAARARIPSFVAFFWPALFVSLGWNFLEYSFDPPVGSGPVWGWLIPGVLFVLMGAVPLWLWIRMGGFSAGGIRSGRTEVDGPHIGPVVAPFPVAEAPPSSESIEGHDLVATLERLDELHRSGSLSDDEFAKAKRRLLS